MLMHRRTLFAVGGAWLVSHIGKSLAGSGALPKPAQPQLERAACNLRDVLPKRSDVRLLAELCGDIVSRCQHGHTVPPALAQATLDACRRSATVRQSSHNSVRLKTQLNKFRQAVRQYIELTAA